MIRNQEWRKKDSKIGNSCVDKASMHVGYGIWKYAWNRTHADIPLLSSLRNSSKSIQVCLLSKNSTALLPCRGKGLGNSYYVRELLASMLVS